MEQAGAFQYASAGPQDSHRPLQCSVWALETVRSHTAGLDRHFLIHKRWGGGKGCLALTPSKSLQPPSSLCVLHAPKCEPFLSSSLSAPATWPVCCQPKGSLGGRAEDCMPLSRGQLKWESLENPQGRGTVQSE